MSKHHTIERKANKQRHIGSLLLLCLFLLVIAVGSLLGLNETRKDLIEECKNRLLWDVQLTAKEVSEDIENKFAAMETMQEMLVKSYGIGPEVLEPLAALKLRYGMNYLAVIDTEYTYYDNEGDIIPETRTENVEFAMEGNYLVARSVDEVSGDGVAFFVPCMDGDEVVGVLVAKVHRETLRDKLSVKQQEGTELVVDASGTVVLMSNDFSDYLGGVSWEEFSTNGISWRGKKKFDETMQLMGCAAASAINKYGEEIYFAAACVEEYDGFYVVRVTSSDVVEREIRSSMVRIHFFMLVLAVFILGVTIFAIVAYLRNRRQVYNAAYVDQLTGIPSKAKHKMDAQELIDKQETRYAYVTFDIDNFKYINEMFGYEYGNRILIHIAKVLQHCVKGNELYARISSDNFAMLLEDAGTEKELTDRIDELFKQVIEYREPEEELNVCTMSFSCGVYRIEGKTDINVVRANANLARIESKKRVLDQIVYFDEKMKSRRVEEKELEYEAEEALVNKEFLVYFQPKYEAKTEKIIGAEALVRWNHPVRGMLSPGLFVPVFEANGFITEIDLYVLNQVCELIAAWLEAGIPPICISVNLSRIHLYERDLVSRLTEVVRRHKVPPEYIEFELTESAFYEETENLLRIMSEIKEAGFRLSMDDFGSGYSSLNLLRRLPVDVLKLDREFFEEREEEDKARGKRIVMHVISMAKDLEMEVLAEGVETSDQKEFLKDAKCDMIQGYYFARPMPMREFELLYTGERGLHRPVHQSAVQEEKEHPAQNRIEGEA